MCFNFVSFGFRVLFVFFFLTLPFEGTGANDSITLKTNDGVTIGASQTAGMNDVKDVDSVATSVSGEHHQQHKDKVIDVCIL